MTTVIHHCDRCGERIALGRCLMIVQSGALRQLREMIDLCGPCAEKLVAWLAVDPESDGRSAGTAVATV